jgi:hypothetical protein
MIHSLIPPVGIRSAGVVLTLALLSTWLPLEAIPCRANPASGLLDLLNPGIASDLGLGGDPFGSAITDQTSWWGESLQANRTTLLYQLEYFEPVSPWLTRGRGWLRHTGNEVRAASSFPVGNGRLFGQLGLSHKEQELMVDELGNMYALTGKGAQGDVLIRFQDLPEGLTFQVSAPLGATSDHMRSMPLGFGIRYGVPDRFIFQASGVRRYYNHALDLVVEDDVINSTLNLSRVILTLDSRLYLSPGSWLAYSFRTNDFGEIDQLTDAYRYEIIPTGRTISYGIDLVTGRQGDFAFLLRGLWLDFDLGGSAYWGGQRFGKINYFRGDHRTGILAFEKTRGPGNRWLADITVTEVRGRAWGKIESWPFTDAIGDLLGYRMTFKGRFRAHWMRLHAGVDRPLGGGRLKVGLVWYNIFPEAQVQNWRSGLGFPIGSRESFILETDHLQVGALTLGGTVPVGRFHLDLEVFQAVFGNSHNNYQRTEGEGEGLPGETSTDPGGWFGGTYARAGLRFLF